MLTFKQVAAQIEFCELELKHAIVLWEGYTHPKQSVQQLARICLKKLALMCEISEELERLNPRTSYRADHDLFTLFEELMQQFCEHLSNLANLMRDLLEHRKHRRIAEVLAGKLNHVHKIPAPK